MRNVILFVMLLLPLLQACDAEGGKRSSGSSDLKGKDLDTAYFASGCFWCVEHIYESVKGVKEAVSGFAGGDVKDPSYRQVASGGTEHAETVQVLYDPEKVSFETLIEVYYASQDPTTEGQDPDFGPQYRSIIFYQNREEKRIAQEAKDSVASSGAYEDPIVTEILAFKAFYPASEHHQDYVEKHPDKGYVRQVSVPRFRRFKERMPELIEEE